MTTRARDRKNSLKKVTTSRSDAAHCALLYFRASCALSKLGKGAIDWAGLCRARCRIPRARSTPIHLNYDRAGVILAPLPTARDRQMRARGQPRPSVKVFGWDALGRVYTYTGAYWYGYVRSRAVDGSSSPSGVLSSKRKKKGAREPSGEGGRDTSFPYL